MTGPAASNPTGPHDPAAGPQCFVSTDLYLELLDRLVGAVAQSKAEPDCFIGMKRSGLFPAVYLSHALKRPMFTDSETKGFPAAKFESAALIDTTCWNGRSLRTVYNRLTKLGVRQIPTFVMFARRDPPPNLPGLTALETAGTIPRFWYELDAGASPGL